MATTSDRFERQLAAIVFTDIVDFSAFVHRDELLGERLLNRQRVVVRSLLPVYGGREIETAGDSFLLEFSSALAAVEAVVAIQQSLHEVCAGHPDDPPVVLRAGVHLGDVERRGTRVFGDGINIAARILPLSPRGGLAMSSTVLGSVRQRLALPVAAIDAPELKQIDSSLDVFVVEAEAVRQVAMTRPRDPADVAQTSVGRRAGGTRSFFAELQRRNVYKAGAMYAVIGWLLVQVATQVLPFFDVEGRLIRALVVLVALGFPVALLISWFYEMTPSGLRLESEIEQLPERPPGLEPVLTRPVLVALLAVAALVGIDMTLRYGKSPGPDVAADEGRHSIAVMPFKSVGGGDDGSYLSSGIQDEILTRLAKIGSLKVISRSSTAYYAAQPANLRTIAKDLSVTHIVEGSVQRHGDSARIAVQLIAADSDSSLWAETYDRQLTDIFGVQSEVATAIATALQTKLTGVQQQDLASTPTRNAKAYDAYLRGIALDARTFDASYLGSTALWIGKAVELDPEFALAWARLARVDANRAFYGFDLQQRPCERARNALETAVRLAPDLGETDLARGYVRFMCDDDLRAAEEAFNRARIKLPNSADVLSALAQIEWRNGDFPAVLALLRKSAELDPRNPELLSRLSLYLGINRQMAEARSVADRALSITPDDATLTAQKALIDQANGDLDGAQKLLDTLPLQPSSYDVFDPKVLQMLYRGRLPEAITVLNTALSQDLTSLGVNVADYHALLATAELASGRADAARAAFAAGYELLKPYDDGSLTDLSSSGVYARGMLCLTATGLNPTAADGSDCARLKRIATSSNSQFALTALEILAVTHVLAGRHDQAFDAIGKLLERPYTSVRYTFPLTPALLREDPIWAPLKSDPRFGALIAADASPSPESPAGR